MSHPFQRSPSLQEFLDWMEREVGYTYKTQKDTDESGNIKTIVEVKNGKNSVVVVSKDLNEGLVSSDIGYLKRRLGIKECPWISIHDEY